LLLRSAPLTIQTIQHLDPAGIPAVCGSRSLSNHPPKVFPPPQPYPP
jgi:hypothetical protein